MSHTELLPPWVSTCPFIITYLIRLMQARMKDENGAERQEDDEEEKTFWLPMNIKPIK